MQKRLFIVFSLVAVAVITILSALVVKRVPEGHQAVRIDGAGAAKQYGPGFNIVLPFSQAFAVYPVGAVEMRFPPESTYSGLTRDGGRANVALELRLNVKDDSGAFLYKSYGADLQRGLSESIRESVEINLAEYPGPAIATPDDFVNGVLREIKTDLGKVGISVDGFRVDTWDVTAGTGEGVTFNVAEKPLRKIIFVGVDGGDWEIIDPLIEAGFLPNFKKILEGGASGRLRSIEPLLSPLIWTSIATGKLPEDHGILNFTVTDPETGKRMPITRMYRKVDALWNIFGDHGRRADVVGWLASYPAEEINGVMVTDRVGYLAYADAGESDELAPGSVSPADRVDEMSHLIVKSADVDYEDFRRFLHVDRETFDKNKVVAFDPENPVNNMIMLYASARSYYNIAKHLLAADQPDFLGVYFEWCDAVGHLFMNFAPPRLSWVTEADFAKYKDAMLQTYIYQDGIIGEFIEMCDDETVLVIASDHGFKSGQGRPKLGGQIGGGHAAFWHQLNGIIAMYGPGIRKGYKIDGATVLDVLPTFLALEGLPQAADMPGKVLIDAFEPALADEVNTTIVATLNRNRATGDVPEGAGAADEETLKKLEALGYITPENPDAYNNLGQRYQEQGKYAEAIEEFKKALALNPNFPSALNNIGVCYGRLKQFSLAEQSFKKALALKKDDVYAMNNLAIMNMELGRFDESIKYGEMAIGVEPKYSNGHLTLGSVYATVGRFEDAEREFLEVIELDPDNRRARSNLQRVRQELGSKKTNP